MAVRKLIYQFRATLLGIEPAIWRRIQVPENYSFWDLHMAIQDAMGWLKSHAEKLFSLSSRSLRCGSSKILEPNETLENCIWRLSSP